MNTFNVEYNDMLKIKYLNKELYMQCGDVKCIVSEVYKMLLKWMKMNSIRQVYLDMVVKKMLYEVVKVDSDIMKKYIECYDRNKDKNDFNNQNLFIMNGDMCIANVCVYYE